MTVKKHGSQVTLTCSRRRMQKLSSLGKPETLFKTGVLGFFYIFFV